MLNFSHIKPYEEFKYWFLYQQEADGKIHWIVTDKAAEYQATVLEDIVTGEATCESTYPEEVVVEIIEEFKAFKLRPEGAVGPRVNVKDVSIDILYDMYQEILAGVAMIRMHRANKNPDDAIKNVNSMLGWLDSTDLKVAPASTQYHESFAGGLVYHHLQVYNQAIRLMSAEPFKNVDILSVALVSLVHDWCKIGLYEPYMRNVKNEATGQWEQVQCFKTNQRGIPLGHGVSSMFLASKFFGLSPEEALAIRWHMASWRVVDSEMNELQAANEKYPLVHLIQFADQLAITEYIR